MLCFRLDPIALPTFSFHFWCRLALQWYFQITMPTENISNCVFCVILYCQKSFRKFLIETQRTYYIAFKTLPPPTLYIQSESYIVKVLVCNVSVFQYFNISIFQYFNISVFWYFSTPLVGESSCSSTPTSPWWSTLSPSGSHSPLPSGGSSRSTFTRDFSSLKGLSWSSSPRKLPHSARFQDARWSLPLDTVKNDKHCHSLQKT